MNSTCMNRQEVTADRKLKLKTEKRDCDCDCEGEMIALNLSPFVLIGTAVG